MTIALVPIPPDQARAAEHVWRPFVEQIAARSRCHASVLIENVRSGDVHVVLAWEPKLKKARALLGVRFVMRGDDRIADVVWLTGRERAVWLPLFAPLEAYLKDHQACRAIRATARIGWSKTLTGAGYRKTHVVAEKDL